MAIVFNARAGGVNEGDLNTMVQALNTHGYVHKHVFCVDELDALFDSAEDFSRIVVLGGDGTARAVAARAKEESPPLIILPGGTMNLLPNALLGAAPWTIALERALNGGRVTRLVGGEANGEAFFVAAMFGPPMLMAQAREEIRKGRVLQSMRKTAALFRRVFKRRISSAPGTGECSRVEAVGILCPVMLNNTGTEQFEWVHLDVRNFLDLAHVGLSALDADWRSNPKIDTHACDHGTLEVRGKTKLPGTVDGEPVMFTSPIRIARRACAPRAVWNADA